MNFDEEGRETPKRKAESLKERLLKLQMLQNISRKEPVDDDVVKSFLFWR